MRQAANSGESIFNSLDERFPSGASSVDALTSHALNKPADDASPDHSPTDSVQRAELADTPLADQASDGAPVAAESAIAPDNSFSHVVTSDDDFWLNGDGSANELPTADGGTHSHADGLTLSADAASDDYGPATHTVSFGENADLFHDNATDIVTPDLGVAPSIQTNAIDTTGGSTPISNGTINEPTLADATLELIPPNPAPVSPMDVTPPGPTTAAPILAWSGDLGSTIGSNAVSNLGLIIEGGTGAGTGTGGGSGSGGVVETSGASSGLIIDVTYNSSVANAPSGFTTAVGEVVSYYESHFSNPVTINIDVGYGEVAGQSLASGALGESETALTSVSYSQLQNALVTNADAIGDTAAAASLPTTSPISGGQYFMSTAEAEALGISGASSYMNGYAGFSSTYNFAYNDSSGVAANQFDFFGVVAHEFSEIMGRTMLNGDGANYYEPLDLFHYSASGVRDFSGTTAGYFSANGGATDLGNFNTNSSGDFGDWSSSVGANSYLAFSSPGVVDPVTANDLTEMNLLGWDPTSSGSAPAVTITLAHSTGSNNVTSNDALTGTADANATVTLSEGSTVVGITTANASGVWSFTPTGLAQGTQTVTASETNAAGLTGSSSLTFTYDTVAPTVTAALAHSTGANNVTSNDALTGTADANATVTLTEGSTVLGTTTANASGVWAFAPTALAQGAQTVTASETNAAGLTGSSSLTFTYDTTAPTVTMALAHDTGGSNNVTANDALTGTADANATVTLSEGSTVLGTATANASGVWAFTPTGLAQGAQTITASETNAAGLTGSASLTFTYNTAAPTVTAQLANDTGSNNVTANDALTGSADANATVTLTEGSTVLGTTTANASGVWAFTPTGLAQGTQTITASETNAAGLTGSSSLTFTYDTATPTVTVALAHDTGDTNNVTSNDALNGTADGNATVTLTEGSTVLGTTTANASGVWAFTPTGLAQGAQTITASETNAAGLTGSSSLTFTYDTTAPTVTAALAHSTGSNNVTSNDALNGTADGNATVTLSEGSTVLGSTTANASGAWAFTPTGLSQGIQTVTASETNAAGLTGSSSLTFTLDTVPPAAPVIATDTINSNNSVTLTGTAEANTTVTVYDAQAVLGTTTANAGGAWSYTTAPLTTGPQSFTATATDAAGNTSAASSTVDPIIGQTTPTDASSGPVVTSVVATGSGITAGAGDLYAGQIVTLTVNLNQAVAVTGSGAPTLSLNDGGTATYTGGSGTNALTFSYTVAAGQNTAALAVTGVNLNGASVTNSLPETVTAGSGGSLTDANGHVWSFGSADTAYGNVILRDGVPYANGSGVTLALAADGVIWAENNQNKWYEVVATGWAAEPNAPTLSPVGPGQAATFTGAVTTLAGPLQIDTATTPTGPAVTSVVATGSGITAGAGDLYAGQIVTLTVNLNQAVAVTGSGAPTLSLNDGGTATYTGGSGTNALTFSYTVAAGQNTAALAVTGVNLNGASVTNSLPETVTAGSGGSLTDANGHVWSFGSADTAYGNVILRDGVPYANGSGVTLALAADGVIWAENNQNKWYEVVATGWAAEPNAPTLSPVGPGQAATFTGAVTTLAGPLQIDTATTPTGPVVTSVVATGSGITAGAGDLYAGQIVTLTVNLNQAVAVTGSGAPTLSLNDGGTATYTGGSGTNALTFSYTVAAGQNTAALAVTGVNLNGASVTNSLPETVTAGSGGSLTDANGHVWSFGSADTAYGNVILRDGVPYANGSGVTLALAADGVIWAENNQNKWYEVVATGWAAEPNAPTLSPVGPGQAATFTGAVTTLAGPLQIDTTTTPTTQLTEATGSSSTDNIATLQSMSVTHSNGMTEIWTYNSDNTLHEVVASGITGQNYTSTDTHYGSNNAPASEVWSNGSTTIQTEAWNGDGTVDNIHYYAITAQPYTDYDIAYGANNEPASASYSNGMTETWTYNSDNTLNEVVINNITGQSYTSTDTHYGANNTPTSEVWSDGSTIIQIETWNASGTINNIHYYDITSQPYTDYDVVYGANNEPASATYSNGMTETWTYNSDNTLHEVVANGITGQNYTSTDTLYGADNEPASEVWSNGSTTIQTETWNANGTVLITTPGEAHISGLQGSTITGGIGSTILDGSAGNVNVTAGSGGTQVLIGGAGDILTGGNTADTFIFPTDLGNETINNFKTATDVIELPTAEVANFAALQADMHNSGVNTIIAFDAHDSITLSNIAAQHLTAQNFHFMI